MAVKRIAKGKWIGLSTDTKPVQATADVPVGATFYEYDTQILFVTPDGTNWFPKSIINPTATRTISLEAAEDYDLLEAVGQDLFIDFLCVIIPRDLDDEEGDFFGISIQSDDLEAVEFLSTDDGAAANLLAGAHLIYRGPDILEAESKIQLTVADGALEAETEVTVFASYRPAVAGGYLKVVEAE